jgi:hypothetical protein
MRMTGVTERMTRVSCHEYLRAERRERCERRVVLGRFGAGCSPEADDEADDDLDGGDEPPDQVGGND